MSRLLKLPKPWVIGVVAILVALCGLVAAIAVPWYQTERLIAWMEQQSDDGYYSYAGALSDLPDWLASKIEDHFPNALDHLPRSCDEVDVEGPRFDDAFLQRLSSQRRLRKLELLDTKITGHGLQSLAPLRELQEFFIRGGPIADSDLECLRWFAKLKNLELDEIAVTGEFLKFLDSKNLESLHVSKCPVTDAGFANLPVAPELRSLGLIETAMMGESFAVLSRCPRLERVWLNDTPVNDTGLTHLAQVKSLQTLDLDNTDGTPAGYRKLAELPKLTELSLVGTHIDESVLEALGTGAPFIKVRIDRDKISEASLQRLIAEKKIYLYDEALPEDRNCRLIPSECRVALFYSNNDERGFIHFRVQVYLDLKPIVERSLHE